MRWSAMFVSVGVIIGSVLSGACESEQRGGSDSAAVAGDTTPEPPLVGGACSYQPLTFRATVDSVFGDGALLVRADSVPATAGACHLIRDEGLGRWRVPGPRSGESSEVGDTVEVAGEVIVMGTCTPCSVNTSVISR